MWGNLLVFEAVLLIYNEIDSVGAHVACFPILPAPSYTLEPQAITYVAHTTTRMHRVHLLVLPSNCILALPVTL